MNTIDSFRGDHDFLSNFSVSLVVFDGQIFPTVEHGFQAAKTMNREERQPFTAPSQLTPGQAKRAGKKVTLRPAWDQVKEAIMKDLLNQKFRDPALRQKLLDTGDQPLVEGNNWNDTYWGVCRGKGQNRLGILLMEVRQSIQGV